MDSDRKQKVVERYLRAAEKIVSREEQQARARASKQRKAGQRSRRRGQRDWEDEDEDDVDLFEPIARHPAAGGETSGPAADSETPPPWIVVGTGPRTVSVSKGGRPRNAHLGGSPLPQGRPVVGDRARLAELPGGEARVRSIAQRSSVLERGDPGSAHRTKPIAVNVDVALLVATAGPQGLRLGLLDRLRIAVTSGGIDPVVVLSKWDQVPKSEREALRAQLAELEERGIPAIAVSALDGTGIDALLEHLAERIAVVVGPSGAGKSTLLNRLDPEHERRTGEVREHDGRGRHTTSASSMHPFGRGGWLIDTPGIREFALVGMDPQTLLASFPELEALALDCPRGCTHVDSPGCAVTAGVADQGAALKQQYASFAKLMRDS